jgi:hypothetical protein
MCQKNSPGLSTITMRAARSGNVTAVGMYSHTTKTEKVEQVSNSRSTKLMLLDDA